MTDKEATGGGLRLEPDAQNRLVFVAYTRGLHFTSKAMGMPEEVILSAMQGDERPELEIKKINHWLQERVS